MSTRTITVGTDGITVSRLCWDLYKSTSPQVVERMLSLNASISDELFIPVGTIVIADIAPPETILPLRVVRLWD